MSGSKYLDSIGTQKLVDNINQSKKETKEHVKSNIYDNEIHGMRYNRVNSIFEVKDTETGEWISLDAGEGTPPENCSDIRIRVGNGKATLFWSDPQNTITDGVPISIWKGTKVVMKTDDYPQSVDDGTLLLDSRIRDQYKDTGFEVTGLTNLTTYYFALFPYSNRFAVNTDPANRISGTPNAYKIMTVKIDQANSNPETSVTYADDAVGMTPGSDEWDEFFGHYPCLFKDSSEVGKLNRNNFDQFEDGSPADISSGNAGDAMIAFPRRGLRISTTGDIVTVSMTDNPNNPEFKYYAHERGETRKEVFYLGVYEGYSGSSKLRSLKGKLPTVNQTIGAFRSQAHANGSGYENSGFYQLTFRQAMYLLKYKNLDSQTAVGMGYTGERSRAIATGGTENKGMDWGETTGEQHMKLFGVEDFWGNLYDYIDGLISSSEGHILTATDNFNDEGTSYKDNGQMTISNFYGLFADRVEGTTEKGFIAKSYDGSATTHFCDVTYNKYPLLPVYAGSFATELYSTGIFKLFLSHSIDQVTDGVGARLMYL